jgi:type III pantothenate kinase
MRLIVDIGNTFTKLGIFNTANKIVNLVSYPNNNSNIIEFILKNSIKKAIISNVGKQNIELIQVLEETNIPTVIFSNKTPIPIKNLYKTPDTLGEDRLAAIIGAFSLYKNNNILIIDAGTALTIDFINKNAEYIGGNISPGMKMRFKALNTFTNKLPLVSTNNSFDIIGNSTESAIISGVQQGMINEINGYIELFNKKYDNLKVLLTGGDSFFFEKNIKNTIFANPELVLIGLNYILQYND